MFMYNMLCPECGTGRYSNNKQRDLDPLEMALKIYHRLEKKKEKDEEKKKKGPPKSGDGPSVLQLFIFLTAITPFVGPASVWATSYMMRQAFENLQAIVH